MASNYMAKAAGKSFKAAAFNGGSRVKNKVSRASTKQTVGGKGIGLGKKRMNRAR